MRYVYVFLFASLVVSPIYANPPKTMVYTNLVTNNDQERCQAEANYMAANNITCHVWG